MDEDQIRELRQVKRDADHAAEYFESHMDGREYDATTALIAAYIDSARRYLADMLKANEQ